MEQEQAVVEHLQLDDLRVLEKTQHQAQLAQLAAEKAQLQQQLAQAEMEKLVIKLFIKYNLSSQDTIDINNGTISRNPIQNSNS